MSEALSLNLSNSNASEMIKNKRKFDAFLENAEQMLKGIPEIGEKAARIPVLVQLIEHYITGEYKRFPIGIMQAVGYSLYTWWKLRKANAQEILFAIIPCLTHIDSDLKDFLQWRDSRKIG